MTAALRNCGPTKNVSDEPPPIQASEVSNALTPSEPALGNTSQAQDFCPELVVPSGSECVLMVPSLPHNPGDAGTEDAVFHVTDQENSTCLCIRLQSFAVPSGGLRLATPGLRERIVLMSGTRYLRVLAYCERHGLSFHVHRHDDELYARLNRDESGG